ncbi:MAG: low specificity L-threonine aldolase [Cyanobacteriota bacterium]|nr:low specificity L-threonine aldolase [Cyanobacteriota bacterium]
MNFCSDNVTGIAPAILEALIKANQGAAMPYGGDDLTEQLQQRFEDLFETPLAVFPVATGSAANALALSSVVPPYGAIYCHPQSHINVDECGSPELFTGGAKLVGIPGAAGKIAAADLAQVLSTAGAGVVHHVQPAAVSLTQATEAGTVYHLEEIKAISHVAHQHGLVVHMDGARFANALVSLGCRPAALTWQAGIDMLSFGATKNGAMAAEAVIFFQPDMAASFPFRRKRAGHLFSKMRFLSAQLLAYLEADRWLDYARQANQMASQLAAGLQTLAGVELLFPVEANELFVSLPNSTIEKLQAAGFRFYPWIPRDPRTTIRLVTAFDTQPSHVTAFLTCVADSLSD